MIKTLLLSSVVSLFTSPLLAQDASAYRDPNRSADLRVKDLLSQLSTEEKIGLLGYRSKSVERLGIPAYNWWNEGLHGVARAGQATVFPQAIGLAASFNDSLVHEVADVISTEARAKYNLATALDRRIQYMGLTFWSPNVNLFRDPRWGRGQETYGEDPFLTAAMGTAYVRGMQGTDPHYLKTAACAKHFAVHSGPEAGRHSFNAVVDEKDLRETYLYAFKKLVDAGVESVMCAYNRLNDEPCCTNNALLHQILREEWKFKGHLVTDCGALDDIYLRHKVMPGSVEVAAAAIKAGVSLDCSGLLQKDLQTAIDRGLVTRTEIDSALAPILRTQLRLGFYDQAATIPYSKLGAESVHSDRHVQLTRKAAQQGMVLLKNSHNILPLKANAYQSIMVLGANAATADPLLANYHGMSGNLVTFAEGITEAAGPATAVQYDQGSDFTDTVHFGGLWAAGESDLSIAVIGLTPVYEGEEGDAFLAASGGDRTSLSLPAAHIAMLRELKKKNKPVIVVVTAGSAVDIQAIEPYADAIILAWYPGEQGGHALADLLFGKVSPSGRLPVTFYSSLNGLPAYEDYAVKGRGYRYFRGPVQFPFGFGLSYSSFDYKWATQPAAIKGLKDTVSFAVTIRNTGSMDAAEVAQVYISYPSGERMPVKELKGFRRVEITQGGTRIVRFHIPATELQKWDLQKNRWTLVPGEYRVQVGASSEDLRLSASVQVGPGGRQPGKAATNAAVSSAQQPSKTPTVVALPTAPDTTINPSSLTRYVDPFIGTGFHGHVFLGASVPFGGVQLGPVNLSEGWDWCSGYHYSDSTIIGFSHTHLSGTGIGDLGDILVMPVVGSVPAIKGEAGQPQTGYLSGFSHGREVARPGYYSVNLDRYAIRAELTASERVGFHRYSFPVTDSAGLMIDLKEGIGWDNANWTSLRMLNDTVLLGSRFSNGWARDQRVWFAMVFSEPMSRLHILQDPTDSSNQVLTSGQETEGRALRALASFRASNKQLKIKVGLSPVSALGALDNIRAEISDWDFDRVARDADKAWQRELVKATIQSRDSSILRNFYTALYHTMIAPSIFNDHNGDYRGTDKKVYRNPGFTNHTTYSLWDTYRGAHPLLTLLQPARVGDMVKSMLAIYQQQGTLPVWHLMGNETNTMPGNSGTQVLADAWLKGIRGYDSSLAFEAMKATAMQDKRGMKFVKQLGFIPADSMAESVAMGLEYSIADAATARVAKTLGRTEDYALFSKRAQNYRNYYDAGTGFVRGRVSRTAWRTPFSPFRAQHMNDDFAEGNAWQYTWLVPHDVNGLMGLMGGEQLFAKRLDSLFTLKQELNAEASADITGLIGQYAHGNEPSHHIAYLYAYAGQPWKTADKVRFILDSLYSDTPAGLSGNEDVGQMSAWYVLSALGFYPVSPFGGVYVFGSPVIDQAELQLGGAKTMKIEVKNNSKQNRYIQRVTLNGKPLTRSFIRHAELVAGGSLVITMGSRPSKWGTGKNDRPRSEL